mgnify:CR=1 FL=1
MSSDQPNVPRVGTLLSGAYDSIADVPGVRVGHCTLNAGALQTGVTVVYPHQQSLFFNKVPAAATCAKLSAEALL